MSLSDVISYSLANTWFLEFFCNSVLESVKVFLFIYLFKFLIIWLNSWLSGVRNEM